MQPRSLDLAALRRRLLSWYRANRRDLPWRRTLDPYAIWISEIMLQQTRVAAVLGHYAEFLKRFPDVETLARADLPTVLAAWSGLGYYRRARALHAAAREIVARAGGLPGTAAEWRTLPGIGRYTAAAIASISVGEPVAVVDGNVDRVVRRVQGPPRERDLAANGKTIGINRANPLTSTEVWRIAEAWLSRRSPGDFNQAMMELGATLCLPTRPRCAACPLHEFCATRGELPATAMAPRFRRHIAYALRQRAGSVYLKQRAAAESLMPGMWELPEIHLNGVAPAFTLRHSITVTDYTVSVIRAGTGVRGGQWIPNREVAHLPLTGLTRKILRRAGVI